MKRVMVVGLGGSGGKTLGFLMDEAMAQLKTRGWTGEKLPDCWSFVHIDIPSDAAAAVAGGGLSDNVSQQGGKYVGVYQPGTNYLNVDQVAYSKFQSSEPNGLKSFVRWRPSPPMAAGIAIAGGAGAYRAVGRTLTLSQGDKLFTDLQTEAKRLMNVSSTDGTKLASLLNTNYDASSSPLIIMVSSMAVGTGSSMILDIADILNGLQNSVPGFEGRESAAFLYTADVFRAWPSVFAGAGAQTLATVSELLNASTRLKDKWNESEWRQLVSVAPVPSAQYGRGPKVVFPVGASANGRSFGNDPVDVYRGFARVMAPLLVDKRIQDEFFNYVNTNHNKLANKAPDALDLNRIVGNFDGAGQEQKHLSLFAGFGSSTLNTGRERFKEYAAQRIARKAAEILYEGYAIGASPQHTTADAKINAAAEALFTRFKKVLNFDGAGSIQGQPTQALLLSKYVSGTSAEFCNAILSPFDSDFGRPGAAVSSMLSTKWTQGAKERSQRIEEEAKKATLAWIQDVFKNLQTAVVMASSEIGVKGASHLLTMLQGELQIVADDFRKRSEVPPANVLQRVFGDITSSKGPVLLNSPAAGIFKKEASKVIIDTLKANLNKAVADVISEMLATVFISMKNELERIESQLKNALNAKPSTVTSAAYREAPIDAWPGAEHVPPHFHPAVNEVLLTDINSFPQDFDQIAINSIPGVNDAKAAITEIAKRVISRRQFSELSGSSEYTAISGWADGETNGVHPHVWTSEEWRPSKLDNLKPTNPKVTFKFTPSDLHDYAESWLSISKNPFDVSSHLSIQQWLASDQGNAALFSAKLVEAINFAAPLVDLDQNMLQVMHGLNYGGIEYDFSTIPMASDNNTLMSAVTPVLGQATNMSNFTAACEPGSNAQAVYISGRVAPYSPWASKSLTDPVKTGIARDQAVGDGGLGGFWTNMRARKLGQFIPVGEDRVEAFLRGWVIGRITGRIQISESIHGKYQEVTVYRGTTDKGDKPTTLTFGKDLLGASKLGINGSKAGTNTTGWNVPAVLLETLPLALAKMTSENQGSFAPYAEVIRLGLNMYKAPVSSVYEGSAVELDTWFNKSDVTLGLKTQLKDGVGEDLEETKNWLSQVISSMENKPKKPINDENFWSVDAEFEIAEPLANAAKTVLEELNRSDLGIQASVKSETQTSIPSVAISQEAFPDDSPQG